jgi:hypothetical protein
LGDCVQHIKIKTKFDITHTNVLRKPGLDIFPIKINGRVFKTKDEWNKARKQQSNWETIIQVVSLRTQPLNIKSYKQDSFWIIEFDIGFDEVFASQGDKLKLLKDDCQSIPMITGLNESSGLSSLIEIDENTFFEIYDYD